ncbi:hypothetical protein EOPP23_14715 [Endozoicomonas sp. OPT23]|uniref:hypothetical protein n=1 Tax=Endozoicomonas sp. OPT23 TaxID=2072845 RepID=UPI00129BB9C8|nr:hypothetical protein [Endozoicomonas sp. OPT23]MRI34244.1 hypothetical protein [Endozoicomonas sp. OPT23]
MEFLESTINIVFLTFIILTLITAIVFRKQGKASEFVNYAPTLLTTLGIFGTFFGIVLGLMAFDQNNIETSIPPLLAGLKTAFFTSLAGMLGSLLLKTLTTTPWLRPKQLEESGSEASPEQILATMQAQLKATEELKESLVGNEESTLVGQLKIMRGDVNDNMKMSRNLATEQFDKQQEQFVEFSDKLWLKMQDFADTLSKSATEQVIEALKQVIVDFNNNLTEQFGENFKQLNDAVYKLVEWQDNYRQQLEQMNLQYEQGVQAITATEVSVAHISDKTQLIPETMRDLHDVMTVNQQQLGELEQHLEAFKDMRDKAVEAVPEIRRQVEETVTDISAAVTTANTHYKELLTESDRYIQNHIQTSEDLLGKFSTETEKGIEVVGKTIDSAATEFTNNTARTNESLQTSSDYLQKQTETIKQHLSDTVSELNSTVRDMIEKLVVDAQSINKTMHEANQNLVTDTGDVRDAMLKSTEQLQKQLGEMLEQAATQQVNQAKKTFDAMEEQVRQQVGMTGEAVDSQLKLIDQSMQQEVTRVMTEMGQALAQVTGKFTDDYIKLTQAMNEIVRRQAA